MGITKVYTIMAILLATAISPLLVGCSTGPSARSVVSLSPKVVPVSEVERKTISAVISTADGTFSPCQQWVPINSTVESNSYIRGAICILLPYFTAFRTVDNTSIWCDPLPNGDAALGILYSGSKVKCTYSIPVAG